MPSALKIFAPIVGCAVLAACSSMTDGTGVARQPVSHLTAIDTESTPADTATATDSAETTPSVTPTQQPPPPQCPGGSCNTIATASLGGGYVIMLRSGPQTSTTLGASVVELTFNGMAIYWFVADGDTPATLTCKTGVKTTCVVVDDVGAHGSTATLWAFANQTLTKGAVVNSDTPSMFARDLNADGLVDVVAMQNDYTPNYATGKVQWQTWLSDGAKLTSTGCTPLATTPSPRPTAPATGKCAGT